ncbi:hypothetical protein UFOVP45_8 [uncultured Caudovirales phage]|uniref:Uncharacterized protein n=1 Tax=uncultured Caudovirales phage TaxID=2100421 RepID=A0A6J5KU32_9CAUD|nr:hypothetical protein UFOVP45_8 [uncultured Caudovirales phage]
MLPVNLPSQGISPYNFSNVNMGEKAGKLLQTAVKHGVQKQGIRDQYAKEQLKARTTISNLSKMQFPSSSIADHVESEKKAAAFKKSETKRRKNPPQGPTPQGSAELAFSEHNGPQPGQGTPTRQAAGTHNSLRDIATKPL